MQWLLAHWKDVLLAVSAIDIALIPLFPNTTILLKIRDFLSGVTKS